MIKKWDITNEQQLKRCIDEVIARVDEQEGSEFGMIAAREVIDIVAKHIGPEAYNRAIEDAKRAAQTKLTDLEIDLDTLRVSS